jgi:hypothetical protein
MPSSSAGSSVLAAVHVSRSSNEELARFRSDDHVHRFTVPRLADIDHLDRVPSTLPLGQTLAGSPTGT